MSSAALTIIAIGLGMDAFSVALAIGAITFNLQAAFRLALCFGFFQLIMPLIGWSAGRSVAASMGSYDHWLAFGLLSFVGGKMIWESWKNHEQGLSGDPTRGLTLLLLSVATSIDALAVGLSFAFLNVRILSASIIIGAVAFTMTLMGMLFGIKIGKVFGKKVEIMGGLILIGIGLKILFDHMVYGQ